MMKAVIDVDEILWSFSWAFYTEVTSRGLNIPAPPEWSHWSIFWEWIPKEDAFPIFDAVHARQTSYPPYEQAKEFMDFMKKHFYIIIASHRNPIYKDELVQWLKNNDLPFDEVHVSYDKTCLFCDDEVKVVVDDRPETLVKAMDAGKVAIGLRKPWNSRAVWKDGKTRYRKLVLFETLLDIRDYLIDRMKFQWPPKEVEYRISYHCKKCGYITERFSRSPMKQCVCGERIDEAEN